MCEREAVVAVIDDDEPFRTALVESLYSLGYGVHGFATADEFAAVHREAACDCVITDIHMPGLNGLGLKRLLTAPDCGVPVIMITACTEPELEARVAASGAVCLLTKPFEANILVGHLERALKS
jgi:FixJ family two-component response regulator